MILFNVEGMTCGHCVRAVTKAIQEVDANAMVKVELATQTITVDSHGTAADKIADAITASGYTVHKHSTS